MQAPSVDEVAKEIALRRHVIPDCLHVPIAAVDEHAITSYVGEITQTLSGGGSRKAFLVAAYEPPVADLRFPIWDDPGSVIFHRSLQVWVHIGFTRYRQAYRRAYPTEDLGEAVISHAMNRRAAALKGYDFVRVTPTSRRANSSSAFSENWGVTLYNDKRSPADRRRGAFIQYADLTDLMLMLDMKLGGGVMNAVNEGQKLIAPRTATMENRTV